MTWHTMKLVTNNKWLIEFEPHCKNAELEQFFVDYMNLLHLSTNTISIVFDMRKVTMPTMTQLTKQVLFIQKMKSLHKEKLSHFYLIITTKIVQELVDLVFKLKPPVVPYRVINNSSELVIDGQLCL